MSILQSLQNARRDFEVIRSMIPILVAARKVGADKKIEYSDLLEEHIANRSKSPALLGDSGSMTWGELDVFANRVANWAIEEGLTRGDVVALSMENRPEFVGIWLGLSRIGVVSALLNTNLTGERLAHCMREANTEYWIVGHEMVEAVASALPELPMKPQILVAGSSSAQMKDAEAIPAVLRDAAPAATSFDAAHTRQSSDPVDAPLRAARLGSDGLFLIYTSGTTGLPKAARISHTKAITAGIAAWKALRLGVNDRSYCCLPLYHSAGGMMCAGASLLSGGALVTVRRFSTKRFWSDCTQYEITAFQYIGELCRYLLNSPTHPDETRHQIRSVIGNGLRPEVWGPFQDRFKIPRIVEFYGATEGNFALVNFSGKLGAVGQFPALLRKIVGIELVRFDIETEEIVRCADGFCQRCDFDEPGELLIKIGETTRFEGYTNKSATEKKVLHNAFVEGDAYFRSGDLLRLDAEGFFYFVDRIGDTFRWKGENVATSEVAEVISGVAGIEEANIYGVEIPGTDGRAGMAALVTTESFDIDALDRVVEEGLASYARPIFIRILPQMEITGTFKHRKVDLVREGYDPHKLSDRLYFRDPEKGRYVPLDVPAFERIEAGEVRV
jgi:fatty-acyl-CoA synthase